MGRKANKMIKVAIVSNTDNEGGADRAANRLHHSLQTHQEINSVMYVNKSTTHDPSVIVPGGKVSRFFKEMRPRMARLTDPLNSNRDQGKLSTSMIPSNWPSFLNQTDADIIHLHWPMDGMMSVKDISKIKKPVVWTLHDMWAFCGAEHYSTDKRYKTGYLRGKRPDHESGLDLNRWTWKRKMRHWKNSIHIVAPSQWMADCAKESKLMKEWPVHVIPNPIDTDFWKPLDKRVSREMLNLPQNKKLILFGSFGGTEDKRKGFDLLQNALTALKMDSSKLALVVLGAGGTEKDDRSLKYETHYLGHFYDDLSLKIAYNAVDLLLLPSRQDNLPNMAVEAISCGVPVAAFNICGIPDIIDHQVNGWLAPPFDSGELARGIEWILQDDHAERKLSAQARKQALKNFSYTMVSEQFYGLYSNILSDER